MKIALCLPERFPLILPGLNRQSILAGHTLTRRPVHSSTAKEVEVQMFNRLTSVNAAVVDNAIAVGQPQFSRQFRNDRKNMRNQKRVVCCNVVCGRYAHFGDNQNVNRRLRVHVAKCQAHFVFVDNVCRNLSRNNLFENIHCNSLKVVDGVQNDALRRLSPQYIFYYILSAQ